MIKADGLAAGKGVIIAQTLAEAEAAIDMMFEGGLGAAGAEVVIEEFLVGEEASFFALCDGETAIPLASAQDHKRVGDGDTGPNTGGMGAYSPAPVMTPEMTARTMDEIIVPTMRAMKAMGAPYKGVLFAGLMITKDGPKLIEYNARFGDPETQVLMLRLMSDLVPALIASRDGQLKSFDLRWYPDAALTVVMAAKGYPGDYERGSVIEGLDAAAEVEGVEIFHAGTKADGGKILANGGRVLNVSARGKTVSEAQARAYRGDRPDQMAGGLLPPRHRLAGGEAGEGRLTPDTHSCIPCCGSTKTSISGGAAAVQLPALARMIFVVHGAVDHRRQDAARRRSLARRGRGFAHGRQGRRDAVALRAGGVRQQRRIRSTGPACARRRSSPPRSKPSRRANCCCAATASRFRPAAAPSCTSIGAPASAA